MAPAAPVPTGRELPSKEAAIFKSILKFYEHKQYRKGLKNAEQILKKFPEHGETLAMKGLFLSHVDRKEEAHEFIKKGLKNDLRSHICWHVYGLLHRGDKNYDEAIKCYINALKFDKENIQIIRDLSLLQIQMRNYEGFVDSRYQLFKLRATQRMNWVGLAIAYHLLGKLDTAEKILTSFEETLKDSQDGNTVDFEQSEMMLYRNMIIEETGDFQRALDDLEASEKKILDKLTFREIKARLLVKLGRISDAEQVYRGLLKLNPDSTAYLKGLYTCVGLDGEINGDLLPKWLELHAELAAQYPRSGVIARVPLSYISGEEFKVKVDVVLRASLRKGVPSLFVSLKDIYRASPEKAQIIEDLILSYLESLNKSNSFPPRIDGEEDSHKYRDSSGEFPTTVMWVLYFLAQHFDLKRNPTRALDYINRAIEHTPTLVELYMMQARIYKHAGDMEEAVTAINFGRELDLQDRFINSKCTKYMLRAGQVERAEQTITLFTKAESPDPLADLVDMQCMWFAYESASAHNRAKRYGRALKRLHQIDRHFSDIYDDQFDFHSYCPRKGTLRSYVELLRLEDKLRDQPFYTHAAVSATKLYLKLWELKEAGPSEAEKKAQEDAQNLSSSELKKAQRKARKAELQAAEKSNTPSGTSASQSRPGSASDKHGEKNTQTQAGQPVQKKGVPAAPVDEDPEGKKFTDTIVDYLNEARKFLKPVNDMSPSNFGAWILSVLLNVKRGKFILAIRALLRAKALAPQPDAQVLQAEVSFYQAYKAAVANSSIAPTVVEVIESTLDEIFPSSLLSGSTDIAGYIREFWKRAIGAGRDTPRAALIVAKELKLLGDDAAAQKLLDTEEKKWVLEPAGGWEALKAVVTLEEAVEVHEEMAEHFRDIAPRFAGRSKAAWPLSAYFTNVERNVE
ncbi:NMDA receptor-regulated protein 1-domain-containing protein [Cladochytrium replicatum]|nr:NMDA receptor-regulated protein 1-domain-containing protein [Cladochytrium replicatum]